MFILHYNSAFKALQLAKSVAIRYRCGDFYQVGNHEFPLKY